MKELNEETALITGGASGIGLSIGKRLAEAGRWSCITQTIAKDFVCPGSELSFCHEGSPMDGRR